MKLVCKSVCVIKFAGSNLANCASGSRVVKPCAHKYTYLMTTNRITHERNLELVEVFVMNCRTLESGQDFKYLGNVSPDQNWTSSKRFCTHSLHGLCGDVLFRVKVKNYACHDNYFRFAWRAVGADF